MLAQIHSRFIVTTTLSLLYFLLMAGTFNSLGAVLPLMVKDLHMDWGEAGFGFSLLGLACGLGSLLPAVVIRTVGVSATIAAGTLLLAGGFACQAMTQGVRAYHIGTVFMGLGFCFGGTVAGVHVISRLYQRPSTPIGIYFTLGSLGSVCGPMLFFLINQSGSSWRVFWMICCCAALVIGGAAAFSTHGCHFRQDDDTENAATSTTGGWSTRAALATPQFWIIIAAYTTCLLINTTVHTFAVQHFREQGLTLGRAATLISMGALVGAVASTLAGLCGEKVDARKLTLLSLGSLGLAATCLLFPPTALALSGFVICMGLGMGSSYVSTAMLLLTYFGRRANLELYSLMCMISTLAALGPGIGGMVRDRTGNFTLVFLSLVIIGTVLFLTVLLMRRPMPRNTADADIFMPEAG